MKKYYSKVDGNDIEVDMGTPKYIDIDFSKVKNRYDIKKEGILYHITHLNISFTFLPIFIGNSHCVVFAENMELHHRQKICNILDDIYNCSMNIGFVSNKSNFLHDPNIPLQLIVRERGAGYTKSCGSGATAAAIAMFKLYELENESRVEASKITINQEGDLSVRKNYNPDTFVLIGPSKILSTGELNE